MKTDNLLLRVKNWTEFKNAVKNLSAKEKGDAFERLTQLYLQTDPAHSSKLQKVWLLSEIASDLRDYLNIRAQDQGIDLVAQTFSGEYWAVQCKYRDSDDKSVSLREISTFFTTAYNVAKHISFGLICTTANRLTHKLEGVEKLGLCASDIWCNLDETFFSKIHGLLKRKPVRREPLSPRAHQKKAIRNAIAHYKKNSRGKLIMACGAGKSLIGFWIARALKSKKIIIAVPSLGLVKQSLDVWMRELNAHGLKADWICVCSDVTIGKLGKDEPIYSTAELGVPCLTDVKEIGAWFRQTAAAVQIVFTTYQSGRVIAEAAKKETVIFDLGIMDEAHKTVGAREKVFAHLLYDKNIRIRKRVFMTATERRYQGDSDKIVSMDDEDVYGETFDLLSFKQALECHPPILCDYRIVTIEVNHKEIERLIQKKVFILPSRGNWSDPMTAHDFAGLVALRRAVKKYGVKHCISFHGSIERARLFSTNQNILSKLTPNFGRLQTYHVSGQYPSSERKSILRDFSETKGSLITNARCLTEGVDVPNVDGVFFSDPKQSTIDIVQAVGRALRLAPGKKLGYVIIPLLTKGSESIADVAEGSEYKRVITVLRALAAHDERIIEYFRSIAQKRTAGYRERGDMFEIVSTRLNAREFINSLETRCWNRLAKLAWRPFEDARKFVHSLNFRNVKNWELYRTGKIEGKIKPADIPSHPNRVYALQGWKGWGDWLGTGKIAFCFRKYLSFNKARAYVRKLKLRSVNEWYLYCAGKLKGKIKPQNIPSNPHYVYSQQGWKGMGDWLGTGTIAPQFIKYRSFTRARAYVKKLKLYGVKEWFRYCKGAVIGKKKPDDIPTCPNHTYKNMGWENFGDWLGTGTIAPRLRKYRSFKRARKFVRKLNFKSGAEWNLYCQGKIPNKKKPADIPASPARVYAKKGWQGMGDWLGTGTIAPRLRKFSPFYKNRRFVRKLKLCRQSEWRKYCKGLLIGKPKKPNEMPTNPNVFYKYKGWISWGDWFGTETVAFRLKKHRPFYMARSYIRNLGLKNCREWRLYCGEKIAGKIKPADIPAHPEYVYANRGWRDWCDWLGSGK